MTANDWWSDSLNRQRPQAHEIIELPFPHKLNKIEKLAESYSSGLSFGEIAKRTGIPKVTVRKTLVDAGVGIRNFKNCRKPSLDLAQVMSSGKTPYGYCYLEGKLVMDAREYQVVLDMFRMWQAGRSLRAIAFTLNERRVSTRQSKSWRHEVVKNIIERHKKELQKHKGEEYGT